MVAFVFASYAFVLLVVIPFSNASWFLVQSWQQRFQLEAALPTPQPFGPYSDYCPLQRYERIQNCEVDQVNILQRHGARFPTVGAGNRMRASLAKLQAAKDLAPELAFVQNYTYDLGEDILLPRGRAQACDAGQLVAQRYPVLALDDSKLPFVRASSSERVVESAEHWSRGFEAASGHRPPAPLVLQDEQDLNDTLSNHGCRRYDYGPVREALHTWSLNGGAASAERLNRLAPGSNMSAYDFVNLASFCPLEMALHGGELGEWCKAFTEQDWNAFEHYWDVQKYYFTGPGNSLGPCQGVGYITELLSRLSGHLVPDNTQTNYTLNSSPATFPLDRHIYADFSHDNLQIPVMAAMGLLKSVHVDPSKPTATLMPIWPAAWCLSPVEWLSSASAVKARQSPTFASSSTIVSIVFSYCPPLWHLKRSLWVKGKRYGSSASTKLEIEQDSSLC